MTLPNRTDLNSDTSPLWAILKRNMTQLMVIINGTVLTLIAFFTVNLFVQEAFRDEYTLHNDIIRKEITRVFSEVEKSLDVVETDSIPVLSNPIFEQVFIMGGAGVNNQRYIKNSSGAQLQIIATGLYKNLPTDKGIVNFSTIRKNPQQAQKELDFNYRELEVYVKKPAVQGNVLTIARLSPQKIAQSLALEKNTSLNLVSIHIGKDERPFYEMQNHLIDIVSGAKSAIHNQNINFDIFGTPLVVKVAYVKQKQLILIEIVPWLLLGFGLTLTVIGWMYVYNNHNKATLLADANEALETRNMELAHEAQEKERLNQTLRKSERENRAIINSISDIIFEIDLTGKILFLNEPWVRITGFPIDQTLGHNLFTFIHLQDQEEQKRNVSQLVKGQRQAYRSITRIRTISGIFRSVELAISMLRLDENKALRIVGSFTDIDEQERAERALVEAEKKYRTIWENAAAGIYQMTPEGQLLSVNPAMAKIFGYESSEVMIREIRNAHQQLFSQFQERLRQLKAHDNPDQQILIESEAYRREGRKIWVQENIRPVFDENGNLHYYEGSLEDISMRKETENKLKEAKLESDVANRAKSEFLANMSHELRTPLNSIIGFSEIIKNEVFGPITPRPYWEYARDIHESGRHLLSIINQILDISRIDAGERELKESLVDIVKISKNCLEIMSSKISNANLTLIEIGFDKKHEIIGEEVAIKQMIINLLSNAIKFTPAGGRITLSVEKEISGAMRVSVTDTGVGLDDEEIERAMSPFGVLDGRMNKSTSGIGLGLSLVQALMKLHGGRLEIFSQKGIGTTVTMVFPNERVQASA